MGRRVGTNTLCRISELTLSPRQGFMNSATALKIDWKGMGGLKKACPAGLSRFKKALNRYASYWHAPPSTAQQTGTGREGAAQPSRQWGGHRSGDRRIHRTHRRRLLTAGREGIGGFWQLLGSQSRQITRLFLQSSELWPPPPPHHQASVSPPPLVPGEGGNHSLAGEGMGVPNFGLLDRHCGTLGINVLCGWATLLSS